MKEILEILQKRVTNAFNDCGNSYSVIDAEEDDLKELTAELSQLIDLRKDLIEFGDFTFTKALNIKYSKGGIAYFVDEYLASRPDSKAVDHSEDVLDMVAGQREEKTAPESDQSKLISKYEELVDKIKDQMCIPTFAKNRNTMILQEIDVLLQDIAELKTKTE